MSLPTPPSTSQTPGESSMSRITVLVVAAALALSLLSADPSSQARGLNPSVSRDQERIILTEELRQLPPTAYRDV